MAARPRVGRGFKAERENAEIPGRWPRSVSPREGLGPGSAMSHAVLRPLPVSERVTARAHPRTIGWAGTVSLAMGGSNQSLFVIGALLAAQGTGAVPLLAVGLLLSWFALPGWTELIMMWPNRVGGIAATCAEAFRPYSPVLANLTGVCYWWGWIPTCGLTALLSAGALHAWYLPGVSVNFLATVIVLVFMAVNLTGVHRTTRLAIPLAAASGASGSPLGGDSGPQRKRRLAPRGVVHAEHAVPRRLRSGDECDGRAVPGRLRRPGIRGRGLPRRRDARPRADGPPGDVRLGGDRDGVLRRPAGRVARGARRRSARRRPRRPARSHLRAARRRRGTDRGRLVHGVQHVPRHAAAAGWSVADAVAARRGRSAPALVHAPQPRSMCRG